VLSCSNPESLDWQNIEETVNVHRRSFHRLRKSRRALTLPVTYLILFASLVTLISVTYSFAVVKIGERAGTLKATIAKQNMQLLDAAVQDVAWSYGASKTVYMDDCGGTFRIEVNTRLLTINVTDEQGFNTLIFSSHVGRAIYEFDTVGLVYENDFVRGNPEVIANASSSTVTQLYANPHDYRQLILAYRPTVSDAVVGGVSGKPLNLIRIYVITLNESQNLVLAEKFHLRISSIDVSRISNQWEFNESVASLTVTASLDQTSGTVVVPISSTSEGAVVNAEVVLCSVKIEEPEV
jgi:hypothetical protein